MIYSFYDPEHESRGGLGTYIILDHIRRARELGLPFVYLGYWVEGSQRMQYKIRYRPLDRLGREGWERIGVVEHDRLITAVAKLRREAEPAPEGGRKDCVGPGKPAKGF